jgi:hypothetical protein
MVNYVKIVSTYHYGQNNYFISKMQGALYWKDSNVLHKKH